MSASPHPHPDAIAITAAEAVCSLGLTAGEIFTGLLKGKEGFGPLSALEQEDSPEAIGGQAPELPSDFAPTLPREARYLRHLLLSISKQVRFNTLDAGRCAIVMGTTLHGMRAAGRFFRNNIQTELVNFLAPSLLKAAISDLPIKGLAITTCSACASGLGSILLGASLLRSGRFDRVICGGYDPICEYAYAGFRSLQLQALGPPRPFSKLRNGLRLGEGYAAVVLERGKATIEQNARTLAWLRGGGESSDAHHLTQPDPTGGGAVRAIRAALEQAHLTIDQIDGLFAHATATPDNDGAEYKAISTVLDPLLKQIPVTAVKSRIGHCLGGAGAVELAMAIHALREQTLPPAAGTTPTDLEFGDLQLVLERPLTKKLRATLNISLGFGGSNAAVALSHSDSPPQFTAKVQRRQVHISGLGVVIPGAIGVEAFESRIAGGMRITGDVSDDDLLPYLTAARRVRRLGVYTKLTLATTSMALKHAALTVPHELAATAAILGTTHGALGYCHDYFTQIVRDGLAAANPMLFAEGVPNVAAAHLTMTYQLKAGSQTILGSRTAGLEALLLAFDRIALGQSERIVVSVAEEYHPLLDRVYPGAHPHGHGAVTMVLESERAMNKRGGVSHGVIESVASAFEPTTDDAMERVWRQLPADRVFVGTSMDHDFLARLEPPVQPVHVGLPDLFSVCPLVALIEGLAVRRRGGSSFSVLASDCHGLAAGIRIGGGC